MSCKYFKILPPAIGFLTLLCYSGWIPNTDLLELDFEKVGDVSSNMRKDLHAAHLLAAEKHDLDYFKEILKNFMETRAAELEAKEAAKAEKRAASKAKRKSKGTTEGEEDPDVEMADVPAEADSEEAEADGTTTAKPKKSKKRKAEDEAAVSLLPKFLPTKC